MSDGGGFILSCTLKQKLEDSKCIAAAAAAKSLQSCQTMRLHRQQPTRLLPPIREAELLIVAVVLMR